MESISVTVKACSDALEYVKTRLDNVIIKSMHDKLFSALFMLNRRTKDDVTLQEECIKYYNYLEPYIKDSSDIIHECYAIKIRMRKLIESNLCSLTLRTYEAYDDEDAIRFSSLYDELCEIVDLSTVFDYEAVNSKFDSLVLMMASRLGESWNVEDILNGIEETDTGKYLAEYNIFGEDAETSFIEFNNLYNKASEYSEIKAVSDKLYELKGILLLDVTNNKNITCIHQVLIDRYIELENFMSKYDRGIQYSNVIRNKILNTINNCATILESNKINPGERINLVSVIGSIKLKVEYSTKFVEGDLLKDMCSVNDILFKVINDRSDK